MQHCGPAAPAGKKPIKDTNNQFYTSKPKKKSLMWHLYLIVEMRWRFITGGGKDLCGLPILAAEERHQSSARPRTCVCTTAAVLPLPL